MNPEHQPTITSYPFLSPEPGQPPPGGQPEVEPANHPRIWVAALADYNQGTLHGAWIDAAREVADLQADIEQMLAASPLTVATGERAEEWAVHDYDGFGSLRLDEHEGLGWISRVARGIAEHGRAFAAYADVMQQEELLDGFDTDYLGHYDSLHAYIEQLVNDLGYDRILDENLPASIRPYVKIDVAATADDLRLGGDLHALPASDGGVWIFRG
jgi:antirestriction protein